MNKYLKDLERELRKSKLSEKEIKEIIEDHEEMIEAALKDGLSDDALVEKFGNPEDLAEDLAENASESQNTDEERQANETIEFENIEAGYNVNIKLVNEDIIFKTHDKNSILVEPHHITNLDRYVIDYKENTFTIQSPRMRTSIFGSMRNKRFVVYLPTNLDVDQFRVKVVNGDGVLNHLDATTTRIESTNGDFTLDEITTKAFFLKTVNGDIELVKSTCNEMSMSTVSGDVVADHLTIEGDLLVNTVSGDLKFEHVSCNDLSLRTVSGDITAQEFYPKTLSMSSVSGDIDVVNEDANRPIEIVKKRTISGDVNIRAKQK